MDDQTSRRVEAVRRFNRFYTQQIGVLQEGLLASPFSLTEVRVLYELAHREKPTAAELARDLGLDAGYLSRILRRFASAGLIRRKPIGRRRRREPAVADRARARRRSRRSTRARTTKSRRLLGRSRARASRAGWSARWQRSSACSARAPRRPRPVRAAAAPAGRHRLGDASRTARSTRRSTAGTSASRRWSREIAAEFVENFDPKRERCWIAERDGEIVGSVFLVRQSKTVAQAAAAAGRAEGARPGHRAQTGRRMRALRPSGWLPENDAVDQRRARCRAASVRRGGLSSGEFGKAHRSFGLDLVGQTFELKL